MARPLDAGTGRLPPGRCGCGGPDRGDPVFRNPQLCDARDGKPAGVTGKAGVAAASGAVFAGVEGGDVTVRV